MAVSAAAYDASSADNPTAANMAQQNEPAATPSASAIPDRLPTLIDVPMIARTFGPGLASAIRCGCPIRRHTPTPLPSERDHPL
jgi:hypothetical protein